MIKVGISVHDSLLVADPAARRKVLDRASAAGLDHVMVGDHVSFHGGTGFDGLISAASALSTHDELQVIVGVYQLALRHPVLTARQLASIGEFAPGRLVLGVGAGGEDRSEVRNSGVDPATRGRRLDEALGVLRELATGKAVDHDGEFFQLTGAAVRPAPEPPVPVIIGGKGDSAVRRTARFGDGWLGLFCSARRFGDMRLRILDAAADLRRPAPSWYGVNVWCGLDADETNARTMLARKMESLYRLPYEKFRHVAPAGTTAKVADWLAAFVESGADSVTIVPAAASVEAGVEAVAEVRDRLRAVGHHPFSERVC